MAKNKTISKKSAKEMPHLNKISEMETAPSSIEEERESEIDARNMEMLDAGMDDSRMEESSGSEGMGGMEDVTEMTGGEAEGMEFEKAGVDMPGIDGGGMDNIGEGEGGGTEPPKRRICGTMDVHHRLLIESESYALERSKIENMVLEFEKGLRISPRTGVVRIPVVVHVVWNTATQNISDAQIQSQITVLNNDFRALNTDISQVPTVWQSLAGDAEIEFSLATQDPDNNPTNGITRQQTTVTSFSSDDKVKSSATGGVDAWPTDRYLNLWVCQLSGGLLGYAQFPGGPTTTDGVVVTHSGFGTTGTAAAPFNLGRTATHEIGHWLNLNHIWGDDGTGCSGSDNVTDTPNQGGPNYGNPSFPHISCNNGPNGDMFMNYMDYVDDNSMVMFSIGQIARMDAALAGPRSSFLTPTTGIRPSSNSVVAWGSNRLDAFVLGTNSSLYHKWWNGSSWGPSVTGYEYMGGKIISDPEVVSWGSDRLDAFVLGTNSSLYHKWWNGSSWGPSVTGYEYMGGKIINQPKVVSWGLNRLDVFVLGTNSSLYHKWWNGSVWGPSVTGYEYMGGKIINNPEVASWGPNRLDVFVIGNNSSLYHKWWNGSSWGPSVTGYEYMGGKILGSPKVVSWGPNRLDVFVLGTNSAVYHKWWNGSAWGPSVTGYENMGGKFLTPPAVVSWGPNRIDLFAIGTNSSLYHKWWDGTSWKPSVTGWEDLGGKILGKPRVVAWGSNRLDVFVLGTNSSLYHKWWNGSSWGPSVTGYEYMGGKIIGL